ncbi:phosphatidylserine decarboxylase domain-containing protein [Trichoderma barbatum]
MKFGQIESVECPTKPESTASGAIKYPIINKEIIKQEEELVRVNCISYTLPTSRRDLSRRWRVSPLPLAYQLGVKSRRHFAGELYSVSPYLQRTLPGLLTPNERVVLLSRWRWNFFSYVPVDDTNVGSLKINFDRELRTNSLLTDTAADLAAEEAVQRGAYKDARPVLDGYALREDEEMGDFQFGSTIVLVFEAPATLETTDGQEKRWE